MTEILKEINDIKKIVFEKMPIFADNTGKFIRSTIGILLLKSMNLSITKDYLNYLSAIELIHNASLLHDDVIDNEEIRRGEETVRSKYNSKTAILYGNLLTIEAINLANSIKSCSILNIITSAIEDMCQGELMQQSQLGTIPSLEDYIKKTELKTASLFKAVVTGINTLSGNIFDKNILNFAKNYGIAFQIKNDLDNILSDNSDKKNGIYTAPYIFSEADTITKNSLEKTLSFMDNYISRAMDSLLELKESDYKTKLIGVVKCLRD